MKVKFNRFSFRPKILQKVQTDVGFCFLEMYVPKTFPKSSLSLRSIHLGEGIVDADYTGNISVILTNLSNSRDEFNVGDRITQVPFQKKRKLFLKKF